MSEIVTEIRALIDACQTGGAYSGYADVSRLYDALERREFVTVRESDLGPMATITPAGKARLKKLVEQLTRSVPNV